MFSASRQPLRLATAVDHFRRRLPLRAVRPGSPKIKLAAGQHRPWPRLQVVEAIKELIEDANFDCNNSGFSLQAMDSSHVSLVALSLRADGFEHYRCDRNVSMGAHAAAVTCVALARRDRRRSCRRSRPTALRAPSCRHEAEQPVEDPEVRRQRRRDHHEERGQRRHHHLHV